METAPSSVAMAGDWSLWRPIQDVEKCL